MLFYRILQVQLILLLLSCLLIRSMWGWEVFVLDIKAKFCRPGLSLYLSFRMSSILSFCNLICISNFHMILLYSAYLKLWSKFRFWCQMAALRPLRQSRLEFLPSHSWCVFRDSYLRFLLMFFTYLDINISRNYCAIFIGALYCFITMATVFGINLNIPFEPIVYFY